jgi:hypothetical protein
MTIYNCASLRECAPGQQTHGSPIDITRQHPYIKDEKVLQCERLELFLRVMKETSIISLGGKKKSISKNL